MKWTEILLNWYEENQREFPWRKTKNPYLIWLSEIILQQTRVDQGLPYYESFVAHFPTIADLAAANEEKVLKLWQGLGYYSRARNLHSCAQWVVNENNGVFPQNYKALLKLKGVGDYTASAIASIAFQEPQAVVDGNVYRFLSRYFGISLPIDRSTAHREFKAQATKLMGSYSPDQFNQAMMEFGALQCTPRRAKCSSCPFSANCFAFQNQRVYEFPVKSKKTSIRKRYFNYLVYKSPQANTLLRQRNSKGIWQNLYEFPLVESEAQLTKKELVKHERFPTEGLKKRVKISSLSKQPTKHLLSHQHLFIRFWQLEFEEEFQGGISLEEVQKLPVPVVIQQFIDNHYQG